MRDERKAPIVSQSFMAVKGRTVTIENEKVGI